MDSVDMHDPARRLFCPKCRRYKSENGFTTTLWRTALCQATCRACQSEWHKAHYHKGPRKKAMESKRQRRMQVVNAIKSDRGCVECGESHPATLDFHHRDPMQKVMGIGTLVASTTDMKRVLSEIAKCDVLCSNCHRKMHWQKARPRRKKALQQQRVEALQLRLA